MSVSMVHFFLSFIYFAEVAKNKKCGLAPQYY